MAKVKTGPQPLLDPHPALLVGANTDGKPDFAAVAWAGIVAHNPPAIAIGLQPHRHSLKGIRQNLTFSVNIPSVDMVKETDYCGLHSGADTDKVRDCGFKVFYGALGTAPLIEQCPVNLECRVRHMLDMGSHIAVIGEITETYTDEDCLTKDKPDIEKIKPFVFTFRGYYAVGESLGKPFRIGHELEVKSAKSSKPTRPGSKKEK